MEEFISSILNKAGQDPKRIVYPETSDNRVLKAVSEVVEKGIAKPILLGNPEEIKANMAALGLFTQGIEFLDPSASDDIEMYAKELFNLRKDHGMTLDKSREIIRKENYFGTMMVHMGDADGMIYGAVHPTAETLMPALQIIKTRGPFHKISGLFFMIFKDRLMLFADAAVEPDPDAKDLADIALDTAATAERFGILPKVAMLSFSTKGSAKHPMVSKVIEATKIAKYKNPELVIDGEMQVDAAIEPWVAEIKCPDSVLKGQANVLIFPELNAANIGYKLATFFGKADAVGPVLQGLRKPINDLSRGCTVNDIVNITAITVIEGQSKDNE